MAESQRITLRAACGERADGSWAAARVGDFGPRQGTGKNDKINARELAGLILFGERLIIHTAHEFPTANESFLRMVAIFENYDDLRKRVARIRYANGEQGIEFLSGQRLKYRARTGGSGRGFAKADLVVYDEAQHLARAHVAASGPAKLANPNSQSWYAGSGGFSTSAVAWEMRRQAILGTGGRLAYTEMTGETIEVVNGRVRSIAPDPDDREVWYSCIPGLGRWVTEEGVETMHDELGPDFTREGLCVWDPEPGTEGEGVIDLVDWAGCRDDHHQPEGPVAFGVHVTRDGRSACIAASDGTHGEITGTPALLDFRPGTGWVVARAKHLQDEHGGIVALDAKGASGNLIEALDAAGVRYVIVKLHEHAHACQGLVDSVAARSFRHIGQPDLDAAVRGAGRRWVGDVWLWDERASNADPAPLVAVTLARWAATTDGPSVYETRGMRTVG